MSNQHCPERESPGFIRGEDVKSNFVRFKGFAISVGYFTADAQPTINASDDPGVGRCVDSCFPPDRLDLPKGCGMPVEIRAGRG